MFGLRQCFIRAAIPIYNGTAYGPALISTREFGYWLDMAAADLPKVIRNGLHITNAKGYTRHPGAPINAYFTKHPGVVDDMRQRSFKISSEFINKLVELELTSLKDSNKLVGADNQQYTVIKMYTVNQINVFMRYLLNDRSFNLEPFITQIGVTLNAPPVWYYDKINDYTAVNSLIGRKGIVNIDMPVKQKRSVVKSNDHGRMRYTQIGNSDVISLLTANMKAVTWDYVDIEPLPEVGMLLVKQATKEWHHAKIRKDGHTFTLGVDYMEQYFPSTEPGSYPVEYRETDQTFCIDFTFKL